jgi:hypothetical protein
MYAKEQDLNSLQLDEIQSGQFAPGSMTVLADPPSSKLTSRQIAPRKHPHPAYPHAA